MVIGKVRQEELQIIEEDEQFISAKAYLSKEHEKLEGEQEELLDIDDVDKELEDTISQYED